MEQPLQMAEPDDVPYCRQKARCCCCKPPRWAHCPICLLVLYVLLMPAIYVLAHFLVYPGDDYVNVDGSLFGATCNVFNFTGRYGPVAAERCVQAAGASPVPVVAFGGNGMNMFDTVESVLDFLPKDQQWEVYSLSFPGSQYAPRNGWTTESRTEADALDLLHHISAKKEQKIVVFGWSLGSSVAAFVTSQKPDFVQCVLLGNPFTSIRDVALSWTYNFAALYLYLLDAWPTKSFAENFRVPTIVMSSLDDEVVPVWMHGEIYKQVPVSEKLLVELQVGHMDMGMFRQDTAKAIHKWCVPSSTEHRLI